MIAKIKDNVSSLVDFLNQIDEDGFKTSVPALEGSTIGQHTRHIIELYQALFKGYYNKVVDYEDRQRNKRIETELDFALAELKNIWHNVDQPDTDLIVLVQTSDEMHQQINSSYYRELLYNWEHTIHHQALIKVANHALQLDVCNAEFGVAPSTLKYRAEQQCAH